MKTLRITPNGVTKISPFEAHMGRKPNTPLSNVATTSSANNLKWENAKNARLDRKNLTKPPLPTEIMHDLQQWSEDEVSINQRQQLLRKTTGADKTTTVTTDAKLKRNIERNIDTQNKR